MALGACLVPGTAIAREIPDGVSVQAQDILDGMTLHEKICQMMVSYQYTMMDGSTRVGATETGEPLQRALEAYPVGVACPVPYRHNYGAVCLPGMFI